MKILLKYKFHILGALAPIIIVAIYFANPHPSSKQATIKCPEDYASNEFALYVEDSAKWIAETQARYPNMTQDQLFEARQKLLIANGCQGRGGN